MVSLVLPPGSALTLGPIIFPHYSTAVEKKEKLLKKLGWRGDRSRVEKEGTDADELGEVLGERLLPSESQCYGSWELG